MMTVRHPTIHESDEGKRVTSVNANLDEAKHVTSVNANLDANDI